MKINHIAIWTSEVESLKDFYIKYFSATANDKYINTAKDFESYFLSFDDGCRLELMQMPSIPENMNDKGGQFTGLIHFAISVGDRDTVAALTETLRQDGYDIVSEPRVTGDGYFESVILDPDGNRVEITV